MSTLLRQLRSLVRVTRRDPHLVSIALRAYALMVIGRGLITVFKFPRITRYLGEPKRVTPHDGVSDAGLRHARRIRWAIKRVAPYTPTNSNCYPQALAASYLLRRKRLPSTFYYGATFLPDGAGLETHVWVRCGPIIVTGAPVHRAFAPVSAYAHVPRRSAVTTEPAVLSRSA